ncbi:MAG: flagellar export protein FliJ [Deltaproteobacteria bacterium]|nr:flagellar export protein FliJ [Deltaproteobacteria bacterium]
MAKKFKLQSVLNYRRSLEDQAQQLLATSLQHKGELVAELECRRTALKQYDRELKRRQQEGLTVAEIDIFETQIHHCRRLMEQLQQELERLERQIISERKELLNAARDKQVMEKLKDRQEAEYRKELSRKEREILDEISLRSKGDMS